MRTVAVLFAIAFASACRSALPAPVASAPRSPNPAVLSDQEGLLTMRMLLSAQLSRPEGERYVPLADALRAVPAVPAPVSQEAETVAFKGYQLRMTLSGDKRHFQMSLTPDSRCGTSWFGSEQGLIYVGRGVGCVTN